MPKAVFGGGGSIGHIAPAVAVAHGLKELRPDIDITFVCSKRSEDAEFIEHAGFTYTQIEAPRLSLSFPFKFLNATKQAASLLEVLNPNVVFSKGGYVSLPVCYAAHQKNIPIVLHESDAIMGRANKLIAKWASYICLGFPAFRIPNSEFRTYTGNPIRPEITRGSKEEGFRITGFTGNKPILLVMGGSQGAEALNEAVKNNLRELLKLSDIIHLTGRGKKGLENEQGYWSMEFAYEELPHLYAITDVALSRAGANSIAELAANSIPTILVPLEGVAHNHQLKNAEVVSQSEEFILLRQKDLSSKLTEHVKNFLTKNQKPKTKNRSPDASRQIAKILSKYLD